MSKNQADWAKQIGQLLGFNQQLLGIAQLQAVQSAAAGDAGNAGVENPLAQALLLQLLQQVGNVSQPQPASPPAANGTKTDQGQGTPAQPSVSATAASAAADANTAMQAIVQASLLHALQGGQAAGSSQQPAPAGLDVASQLSALFGAAGSQNADQVAQALSGDANKLRSSLAVPHSPIGSFSNLDGIISAREKNRQAQRRFRERQKTLIQRLKEINDALQAKYEESQREVIALREENTMLKGRLEGTHAAIHATQAAQLHAAQNQAMTAAAASVPMLTSLVAQAFNPAASVPNASGDVAMAPGPQAEARSEPLKPEGI